MRELLIKYHGYLKNRDMSDNTISGYMFDLHKFVNWYARTVGQQPTVNAVSPVDIVEFRRHMLDNRQSPATINRALSALSSFYGWAVSETMADTDPTTNIKKVKQGQQSPRSLPRRNWLALVRAVTAAGKSRDIAIVTLMLLTGLRVSEVCDLRLSDMVLRERSGWVSVIGKGGKHRELPLNVTARRAIADYMAQRGVADGPLFMSQKGGGLKRRAVNRIIDKYALAAGLSNITPHVLRHTFCTSLIDKGVSIDRVAILAGHASLNTTARYTVPTQAALEKSVDLLAWE